MKLRHQDYHQGLGARDLDLNELYTEYKGRSFFGWKKETRVVSSFSFGYLGSRQDLVLRSEIENHALQWRRLVLTAGLLGNPSLV